MCEHCEEMAGHISTLMDAWARGSDTHWDTSEPFFVGGLGSVTGHVYSVRAPFMGPCQWCVDIATAGGTQAQILVSPSIKNYGADMTGLLVPGYQDSQMDGLVIICPQNQTVPIDSNWYDLRNSENTLYVTVVCATNSAGANIQFRQKRMAGGDNGK
jgi:hypothetical protein